MAHTDSNLLSDESQEISAADERERDEVVKRMLATPPQPRVKPEKKKAKA